MDKERSNTITVTAILIILVLLAAIVLWGFTRDEKWVLYTETNSYVEHAYFSTYQGCEEKMKLFNIPVGCKRVDGIYGMMNDGLSSLLR